MSQDRQILLIITVFAVVMGVIVGHKVVAMVVANKFSSLKSSFCVSSSNDCGVAFFQDFIIGIDGFFN